MSILNLALLSIKLTVAHIALPEAQKNKGPCFEPHPNKEAKDKGPNSGPILGSFKKEPDTHVHLQKRRSTWRSDQRQVEERKLGQQGDVPSRLGP